MKLLCSLLFILSSLFFSRCDAASAAAVFSGASAEVGRKLMIATVEACAARSVPPVFGGGQPTIKRIYGEVFETKLNFLGVFAATDSFDEPKYKYIASRWEGYSNELTILLRRIMIFALLEFEGGEGKTLTESDRLAALNAWRKDLCDQLDDKVRYEAMYAKFVYMGSELYPAPVDLPWKKRHADAFGHAYAHALQVLKLLSPYDPDFTEYKDALRDKPRQR